MDKNKFNTIFKHFTKPISEMKMTYECSATTSGMRDTKVIKCFEDLVKALSKQLDSYR